MPPTILPAEREAVGDETTVLLLKVRLVAFVGVAAVAASTEMPGSVIPLAAEEVGTVTKSGVVISRVGGAGVGGGVGPAGHLPPGIFWQDPPTLQKSVPAQPHPPPVLEHP